MPPEFDPPDGALRVLYQGLLAQYGAQPWWPAETAFEVVVGAVLTQNAAWSNVEKAIAQLKAQGLLALDAILASDHDDLAAAIRPSGYFNIKADRLKQLCRFLDAAGGEAAGGTSSAGASTGGEAAGGEAAGGSSTGGGGSGDCVKGEVAASEVIIMGESFYDWNPPYIQLTIEEHACGVRMRELAHRTSLPSESRYQITAREVPRVEDLDRHVAIHVRLFGLVDGAHSAFADLLDDAELSGHFFAEVGVAHDAARVASEPPPGEESASRTSTIQVASAISR